MIGSVIIGGIGTLLAWQLDSSAGLVTLITVLLLLGVFLFHTLWRYRKIADLSQLLSRIASGAYDSQISESEEGELSILRSEIYKLTVTLRQQAEMLGADKRFLADSISDISHQLKTPLTSMSVMTDLLQDERLSFEKRLEFTQNIRSQLRRLQWLVSALLTLAQLDAGSIQFQPTQVRVKPLIEEAIAHLHIPLELKNQTLELQGDENVTMLVDRKWTSEALSNVVKNCIEHTPIGGTVGISWEDSALFSQIRISDNGSGINPQDLPFVFERFYKGRQTGKESIGIGLAMTKSIVLAQGGCIEAQNRGPHGAQFTIKFYKPL